mmetsp:Transcript_19250/g.67979  ORF Transcript_19250/g.67979 Transcript_19250/m.67979 type:complete len:404 (+) Transcript_19250:1455-2666(+)
MRSAALIALSSSTFRCGMQRSTRRRYCGTDDTGVSARLIFTSSSHVPSTSTWSISYTLLPSTSRISSVSCIASGVRSSIALCATYSSFRQRSALTPSSSVIPARLSHSTCSARKSVPRSRMLPSMQSFIFRLRSLGSVSPMRATACSVASILISRCVIASTAVSPASFFSDSTDSGSGSSSSSDESCSGNSSRTAAPAAAPLSTPPPAAWPFPPAAANAAAGTCLTRNIGEPPTGEASPSARRTPRSPGDAAGFIPESAAASSSAAEPPSPPPPPAPRGLEPLWRLPRRLRRPLSGVRADTEPSPTATAPSRTRVEGAWSLSPSSPHRPSTAWSDGESGSPAAPRRPPSATSPGDWGLPHALRAAMAPQERSRSSDGTAAAATRPPLRPLPHSRGASRPNATR